MLGLAQSVRSRVIWCSANLSDVEALTHRGYHAKELFASIGKNNFGDSMYMDPVVA